MTVYAQSDLTERENTADWDEDTLFDKRINDLIRVAQASNRWGTIAGHLREQVLAALRPKLDYRAILRQFRAYIDEHRAYDGLIVFTDGYAPLPPPHKTATPACCGSSTTERITRPYSAVCAQQAAWPS